MLRLAFRSALSVAALAGAVVVGLRETDVWTAPDILVVLSLVIVAVFGATEPFFAIRDELRWRSVFDLREHARRELDRVAVSIADATSIPIETLRVQALLVRERRRLLRHEHFLTLLEESRLKARPGHSGVTWTRGKGVIGICWMTEREASANLDHDHNILAECTAEEWARQPPTLTYNLTYEDFRKTVGKYGIVLAQPMMVQGHGFLGCVAVGGASGRSAGLDTDTVLELVQGAADNISGHLRPPHKRAVWLTRLQERGKVK